MRGCEMIWDADDAARVQQLVEQASGGECPCLTGLTCPLMTPQTLALIRDMTRRATLASV